MTTQPDYSSLPYYPSPWSSLPQAAGFSVCGYANLPTSKAEASRWAATYAKLGARVLRVHKVDIPLRDNPSSHIPRLQRFLDALQKKQIPVLMEVIADRPISEFQGALTHLAKLDLSNVVGICPVNEPQEPYPFDTFRSMIRQVGFTGYVFGSNSVKQGGSAGDLLDIHAYCGLEGQKSGEYFETLYNDEPWNHPKGPVDIATEIGHPPPATTRSRSEDQIIDVLFERGCRVFILFALLDRPELWKLSNDKELRLEACCQDPLRMETWRRLVQRCVGPAVNLSGVQCEQVDRGKWRIV